MDLSKLPHIKKLRQQTLQVMVLDRFSSSTTDATIPVSLPSTTQHTAFSSGGSLDCNALLYTKLHCSEIFRLLL